MPRRGISWRMNKNRRDDGSSSNWASESKNWAKPRAPPGLRGRQIGLFYRDLHKKNGKDGKPKHPNITLRIPKPVVTQLISNLDSISKIAEKENIKILPKKYSVLFPDNTEKMQATTEFHDDIEIKERLLKLFKSRSSVCSQPSPYQTADFIPLKSEPDQEYGTGNKILSLRGAETVQTKTKSHDDIEIKEPSLKIFKSTSTDFSEPGSSQTPDFIPIKSEPNQEFGTGNKILSRRAAETVQTKTKSHDDIEMKEPSLKIFKSTSTDFSEPGSSQSPDFIPIKSEPDQEFGTGNKILSLRAAETVQTKTKIHDDIKMKEPSLKIFKSTSTDFSEPGSSHTPDFIPIKSESDQEYGTENRMLSLRGAGDFKYGYNDIITGTFNEKLEECLSKGINITKSNEDVESLNLAYYEEHQNRLKKAQYIKMKKFREMLPAYKKSEELLDVINNNQVVVISGETGCGKSTQVPQIILDDAIMNNKGANVKLLITQPRRIAASSLAARVASERAESMGTSAGYAVRLEKVDARARGSMMFCTTGVLLVDLELNQGLTDYSHVILDEVHERDCHIDFAMCMLKQVLQKRKDLKLILMSATLDADKLSGYFGNCPLMHIEGLAYPVKDIYLEEILHLTNFQLDEMPQQRAGYGIGKPHLKYLKNRGAGAAMEKAIQYRAEIGPWLESVKGNLDPSVYRTLQDHRIEDLNINLIFELVKYICRGPPGAILVFLPGIGEITKLLRLIEDNVSYLGSKCEVYPLHSKLSSLEQHKIFETPPDNIRKIIVATNIAETSITIDDILYVVDCGKIKYSGLNVEHYFSTLRTEWISQANLRQRRGRAGRCQPGVCYHLLTTYRAEKLDERLLPELQRSNLLEPVLTIKRLRLGKAAEALKNVPDSPADTTIERAITHLQRCGALDDNETLTPLGWHLARLPVHPAAGKLVLFGALFGCLDRAASVAAAWSFKDPFLLIIEKEDQVKAVKRDLALGEPSDHVAISEAVIQWERCSHYNRRSFAYDHFLSNNTIELLSDMKNQIGDNLKQMGFLSSGNVKSAWENRNSENISLFKAIVAASLYPNIATARWTNSRNPRQQQRVKTHTPEGPVQIHPSSIMCPPKKGGPVRLCSNAGANWLVYWLKQKSSDLFIIDVTLVYSLPLLFFGELKVSDIEGEPSLCYVSIATYKVQMQKETAELILELRNLLDQVLASKIMVSSNHCVQHSQFEEQVLNAVIAVITAEDERTEYLGDTESDSSECESRYK